MKRIVSICAIAAMICGAAAWAVPPVQYPLISEHTTGAVLADCGDFLVLYDYSWEGYERHYFYSDGSLKTMFWNWEFPGGLYYNSNDPSYWLAGKAEHHQWWLHFNKDGKLVKFVGAGVDFKVTAPGFGGVFINAGRIVLDFNTGEWVFTPRHDFMNEEFDMLCAALRP